MTTNAITTHNGDGRATSNGGKAQTGVALGPFHEEAATAPSGTLCFRLDAEGYHAQLVKDRLAPVEAYAWFSTENRQLAQRCYEGSLIAAAAQRNDQIQTLTGAVLALCDQDRDLRNHDRAFRAGLLLQKQPSPIREIPTHKRNATRHSEHLKEWRQGIPVSALTPILDLVEQAMPDRFIYVEYKLQQTVRDPLIYAQYGEWYVKVAEWEEA